MWNFGCIPIFWRKRIWMLIKHPCPGSYTHFQCVYELGLYQKFCLTINVRLFTLVPRKLLIIKKNSTLSIFPFILLHSRLQSQHLPRLTTYLPNEMFDSINSSILRNELPLIRSFFYGRNYFGVVICHWSITFVN